MCVCRGQRRTCRNLAFSFYHGGALGSVSGRQVTAMGSVSIPLCVFSLSASLSHMCFYPSFSLFPCFPPALMIDTLVGDFLVGHEASVH